MSIIDTCVKEMEAIPDRVFKPVSMIDVCDTLSTSLQTETFKGQHVHLLYLKKKSEKDAHYEACVKYLMWHGADTDAKRINEVVDILIVDPVSTKLDLYQKHAIGSTNGVKKKLVGTSGFLQACVHFGSVMSASISQTGKRYLLTGPRLSNKSCASYKSMISCRYWNSSIATSKESATATWCDS